MASGRDTDPAETRSTEPPDERRMMKPTSLPYPGDNNVRHLDLVPAFDATRQVHPDAWALAVDIALLGGAYPESTAPDAMDVPLIDPDGHQLLVARLGDVLDVRDPEDVQRAIHGALAAAAAGIDTTRVHVAAAQRLLAVAETLTPIGVTR